MDSYGSVALHAGVSFLPGDSSETLRIRDLCKSAERSLMSPLAGTGHAYVGLAIIIRCKMHLIE